MEFSYNLDNEILLKVDDYGSNLPNSSLCTKVQSDVHAAIASMITPCVELATTADGGLGNVQRLVV